MVLVAWYPSRDVVYNWLSVAPYAVAQSAEHRLLLQKVGGLESCVKPMTYKIDTCPYIAQQDKDRAKIYQHSIRKM